MYLEIIYWFILWVMKELRVVLVLYLLYIKQNLDDDDDIYVYI